MNEHNRPYLRSSCVHKLWYCVLLLHNIVSHNDCVHKFWRCALLALHNCKPQRPLFHSLAHIATIRNLSAKCIWLCSATIVI